MWRKEPENSNRPIADILQRVLEDKGLPKRDNTPFLPDSSRERCSQS